MIRRTYAIIIAVAAASIVISSSLYFSYFGKQQSSDVITKPSISEQQAIDIVSSELAKRHAGFEEKSLKLYSSEKGYIGLQEFRESGMKLPLKYYHPNGTQFNIDSETDTITSTCPADVCGSFDLDSKVKGKLVYILDLTCLQCKSEIYAVDAIRGNIIYSSLIPETENKTGTSEKPVV